MLSYEEHAPSQGLREYIECFWILKTDFSLENELCLPDGSASLIFNFSPPHFRAAASRPAEWQKVGLASLLHQGKESILINQKKPVRVMGVRFKPYGMAPFFKVSMLDFAAPFFFQEAELTPFLGELPSRLLGAKDFSERIAMLEENFLARLPDLAPPDELAKAAVTAMVRGEGNVRIGDLLEELCVSKSTLEKKFQEAVGLSPKILCNILRFNSLIYNHARLPAPSLTELSYNQGFFDQAHLVHNFKSFTGLPPGRFFRQDNQLVEILRQSFAGRMSEIYS